MKQKIKLSIFTAILGLISLSAFSQEEQPATPKWVSDKGYWVLETNIHSPLNHTIWFYNNDNVLVYKETVNGVKLNPAKRKTKMKLKKVLEASLIAWEGKGRVSEDGTLVKMILR